MLAPSFLRPTRVLAIVAIALCSVPVHADFSTSAVSDGRIVLAQAVDGATPSAPPSVGQAPGAPSPKEAIPDVLPGLNKKRVAFWGVAFMLFSSLVFTVFGAWAIWKTPKPGQQRPDSYEKKHVS